MSAPEPVDGWGPSHQSARPAHTKNPLWFRAWTGGLLLAWYSSGPTLPRFILLVGGGSVLALLIHAYVHAGAKERSPASRLAGSPDPLRAVLDESARHGAGVYLGTDDAGRWQTTRPERAVMVLGPPRSGKSSAVMIPALLAHLGPAVSTSTKPDVMAASVPARARMGNVWRFDPTGSDLPTGGTELRWSPVTASSSWDGALLIARAMVSGAGVGTGTTEQSHWSRRASALLAPLLHAAASGGRDVEQVVDWVLRHELDEPGMLLRAAGAELACGVLIGLQNTEVRERSSIFSAAADALDAYTGAGALAATREPNFDAERFVASSDTIYIHAPAERQALTAPLVCGLLSEIRAATYNAHRQGHSRRVLFALDEAANIAPLSELPQIASEGGGQGLSLVVALQDLSQARMRWGVAADGFLTLFGSKLILPGVADSQSLEAISVALGEYDRQVVSETRGPSRDSFFALGTSRTFSTQRQRVLSPGEIANIPAGHALYLDGLHWELLRLTPAHIEEPWRTLTQPAPVTVSTVDEAVALLSGVLER